MPLTTKEISSTKATDKPIALYDGGGLLIIINPNNSRWWRLRYRFNGKQKTLSLGVYPEVGLKEAREKREAHKALLAKGINPSDQRKEVKYQKSVASDNTFKTVALAWWNEWKGNKSPSTINTILQRIEQNVFPAIGDKLLTELTAKHFMMMAKGIEARGLSETPKRSLQTCGQVMRFAVAHGLVERNPVADVKPSDVLKPHKRRHQTRLDAKDVPELLRDIDGYIGSLYTRLAMQLMALTFVRTKELIQAKWEEIEFPNKLWRIPAVRMKMKTPHLVPLSWQAIEILEKLKTLSGGGIYIFPGEQRAKTMSNNTILYALYRMGYRSRMTGHGFRSIASTMLHEMQFPHEHIELQLAHQERDEVSASYNGAQHLQPRTAMMQVWADHLDSLRAGATIIPFQKAV